MAVRPEMEEQAKDMVEGLKTLTDQVQALNKSVDKFLPIVGSTGLDLSIPALRSLRRVLTEGKDPEPFHPQGCDFLVFREILGTSPEMSGEIWKALGLRYDPRQLRRIPGMTDELMAKIRSAFVLDPDPDEPTHGDEPQGS